MLCPDEKRLKELAAGVLSVADSQLVEAHVVGCRNCGAVLDALGRVVPVDAPTVTATPSSQSATPSHGLPRGTVVGRYVLLDILGAGGMGVVYAAYDPELGRKVAIKLIRPATAPQAHSRDSGVRQLREAQALARLVHPNVVSVFDAGTFDGEVFMAMELVDGVTATQWLESSHPWREVRRVLLEAGEGLAAAHRAGLVHRDFKPANILVGHDGRVRVTDFGLAHAPTDVTDPAVTDAGLTEAAPRAATEPAIGGLALRGTLTSDGRIMGTPAYMAPEQHLGHPTDARADQFSFCVVLYEALYGQRPFAGATIAEIGLEVLAGNVRPVSRPRAPKWLDRVIRRGLRVNPEERWPSMQELLAALCRRPSRRRRLVASAAIASAAIGAAIGYWQFAAWQSRRDAERALVCTGAEQELRGAWDAERRQTVDKALKRTGVSYAAHTAMTVNHELDAYANAWITMHTEACEATRVRGEQSEELLDLRMACLARKRSGLAAITERLVGADVGTVANAQSAVYALESLHECSDANALRAAVRPPADPATRALVQAVGALVDTAKALQQTGDYRAGIERARGALARARGLHYQPLEAKALGILAVALIQQGDAAQAEQTLVDGLAVAESSADDHRRVGILLQLMQLVGCNEARPREARVLATLGQAAVARLGNPTDVTGHLLQAMAAVAKCDGRLDEALSLVERAVAHFERYPPPDPTMLVATLNDRALTYAAVGRTAQAIADYDRALALNESLFGPDHPNNMYMLSNLADTFSDPEDDARSRSALERAEAIADKLPSDKERFLERFAAQRSMWHAQRGEYDAAEREADHALTLARGLYGDDQQLTLYDRLALAGAKRGLGKLREAEQLAIAVTRVWDKTRDANRSDLGWALSVRGEIAFVRSAAEALPLFERAAALTEAAAPLSGDPRMPGYLCLLGGAQRSSGRLDAAMRSYERARAQVQAQGKADRSAMAGPLLGIGEVWIDRKLPVRALEPLERARKLLDPVTIDPALRARTEFALAKALWETGGDRVRAVELANHARAGYARRPAAHPRDYAEVVVWLKRQPGVGALRATPTRQRARAPL